MFHSKPLRWAISKAIEQSVLTGSALISGADLMKSILVIAGYTGDYGYGPLIVSSGGQALVLAALNSMSFVPTTVGRVIAFPGAVIHRGQYYDRLRVGSTRSLGGSILRTAGSASIKRKTPDAAGPTAETIEPSSEGAASAIDVTVRETQSDLELVVRSRQADGTVKEHDLWHCITAALTANVLGDCNHRESRGYTTLPREVVTLSGTGTNLGVGGLHGLTIALVGRPLDALLACGVSVNMVMRTSGCLACAVSACKQIGYRYIVS
jgi:hypothetical protein